MVETLHHFAECPLTQSVNDFICKNRCQVKQSWIVYTSSSFFTYICPAGRPRCCRSGDRSQHPVQFCLQVPCCFSVRKGSNIHDEESKSTEMILLSSLLQPTRSHHIKMLDQELSSSFDASGNLLASVIDTCGFSGFTPHRDLWVGGPWLTLGIRING